jgi:WD40 repeat protein
VPRYCVVSTLAGNTGAAGFVDGIGAAASFNSPVGITVNASTGNVFVAELSNHAIRQVGTSGGALTSNGVVSTVLTMPSNLFATISMVSDPVSGLTYFGGGPMIYQLSVSPAGYTVVAGSTTNGATDGVGTSATLAGVEAITIAPSARMMYAACTDQALAYNKGCRVRGFHLVTGAVTTIAGGTSGSDTTCVFADASTGASARFVGPRGIAWHPNGNLYVAGSGDNRVRVVSTAFPHATSTLAGSGVSGSVDGVGALAQLTDPRGIVVDLMSGGLLVAEYGWGGIRTVALDGTVGTLVGAANKGESGDGSCVAAGVAGGMQLAITADGSKLYLAQQSGNRVRVVSLIP